MEKVIDREILYLSVDVSKSTVIRIKYHEHYNIINELEIFKIISETENTIKLSNGVTLSKYCLFPYHKKNYYSGEEYFLLDKIIL